MIEYVLIGMLLISGVIILQSSEFQYYYTYGINSEQHKENTCYQNLYYHTSNTSILKPLADCYNNCDNDLQCIRECKSKDYSYWFERCGVSK